jgi:hypothetical protein
MTSTSKVVLTIPSLSESCINLSLIRDDAHSAIKKILLDISNTNDKSIILDQSLSASINLMIKMTSLKEYGVSSFHILNDMNVNTNNKNLVYIIRPSEKLCKIISSHIIKNLHKKYYIVFLPNKNIQCERVFEYYGIWSYIKILELPINLVPIDNDILSMEHSESFKNMVIDNNYNPILNIVHALINLQEKFGIIPCIQGIGYKSQLVVEEMIKEIHSEEYKSSKNFKTLQNNMSQIGRMIIIDRDCDYVTPLLTQHVYSGLIDEVFKVRDNSITIPKSMHNHKNDKEHDLNETTNKVVNSDDLIYKLLSNEGIDQAGIIIRDKIKLLNDASKIQDKTDIKNTNKSLKELQKLEEQYPQKLLIVHFNMIKQILDTLHEDNNMEFQNIEQELLLNVDALEQITGRIVVLPSIIQNKYEKWIIKSIKNETMSPLKIIRILCLYSIVNDGINLKFCDDVKSLMIKSFGVKCCFLFEHLFKAGILKPKLNIIQGPGVYQHVKNTFSLIADYENVNDIAAVYDGYAPLSCRIIEYGLTVPIKQLLKQKHENVLFKGWLNSRVNKKLNLINWFPSFHVIQNVCPFDIIGEDQTEQEKQEVENQLSSIVLVCFVGGITWGEITALRTLTKLNHGKHIIIMTTKIINGNTFIESLL